MIAGCPRTDGWGGERFGRVVHELDGSWFAGESAAGTHAGCLVVFGRSQYAWCGAVGWANAVREGVQRKGSCDWLHYRCPCAYITLTFK